MLRRVTSDRYEADEGDRIQIVTKAQNNNGVNDARFEYDSNVLPRETIQGLPGASFTVAKGRKRFQAVVAFDAGAKAGARYDVFEVDEVGGLTDLRQHVSKIDSSPLVGFAVEGVSVAVPVGAGPIGMAAARPPVKAKKAAAKKASRTTARKRTAKAARKQSTAGGARTRRRSTSGKRR